MRSARFPPSKGFSLIELMIALLLGTILTGAIIQVLVSNQVTERLNRAMASAQENARYITQRMQRELLQAGRYDHFDFRLNRNVDTVSEAAFVQNHPVFLPGDFAAWPDLGAKQGASGATDTLVVGMQASADCRGKKLGYVNTEQFHVVNEYFVSGSSLMCRGFDGRVLRGLQAAVGHDGHAAVTILDDVADFQVLYGIAQPLSVQPDAGRPAQFVTADALPAQLAAGNQVVSIRLALLLKGEGEANLASRGSFKLLNEAVQTAPDAGFYRQVDFSVALRNMKNFIRGQI